MKKLILFLGLIVSGSCFASSGPVPQCFDDAGVSAEEPYILTIPNINPYQIHMLIEDIISDGFLSANKIFDHQPTCIFALSVNTSMTLNIDEKVAMKVEEILGKYKLNYSLECNGVVTGNPRAGGRN